MKKQIYIYAVLIAVFAIYHFFFRVEDERLHTIISILMSSFLFLYLAYLAYVILKKIKNASKK